MKILLTLCTVLLIKASPALGIVPFPSSFKQSNEDFIKLPANIRGVGSVDAMRELKASATSGFTPAFDHGSPLFIMRAPSGSSPLPPESYRLSISGKKNPDQAMISLEASCAPGFFYGIQTLSALLEQHKTPTGYNVPHIEIIDSPQYAWRGLHLDVSRHFFSVGEVKTLLDTMSLFKLNKLHLHLTDGPGWRIQINRYPQLTKTGAWRKDDLNKEWNWPDVRVGKPTDGHPVYGGFYTQNDLRELISYAAARHIEIIPEIDIPGHCYAALVSLPSLACDNFEPLGNGLSGHDYICMGREESFQFVTGVLEEIIALLPESTPIHTGGDELISSCGSSCAACRKVMEKENLNSSKDLQRWFMNRVIDFLRKKGKNAITWDDAYDAGVRNQTVMCWRGEKMAIDAAQNKHSVILCPASHFYFDYYQGNPKSEPKAIGGLIPLEKVFEYSPPPIGSSIKGIQGNLWTEYINNKEKLEYMAWPRGIALAERAWGSPKTSFKDFTARMSPYLNMLKKRKIQYRPLSDEEKTPSL